VPLSGCGSDRWGSPVDVQAFGVDFALTGHKGLYGPQEPVDSTLGGLHQAAETRRHRQRPIRNNSLIFPMPLKAAHRIMSHCGSGGRSDFVLETGWMLLDATK
jgi:hypothetical protein